MVNIKELHDKRKEKADRNHELYRGFFMEISQKIKKRDLVGYRNVIHRIPSIILGFPMYDINHALQYVMNKLQKNGFFVCPWKDNYLYIDWSISTNSKDKRIKRNMLSLEELDEKIKNTYK